MFVYTKHQDVLIKSRKKIVMAPSSQLLPLSSAETPEARQERQRLEVVVTLAYIDLRLQAEAAAVLAQERDEERQLKELIEKSQAPPFQPERSSTPTVLQIPGL